jgi:simple sugar transport system ATP-binding protein
MILDEPTSVLTPAEADEVLGRLQAMCREGRLTVLLITHKFREVLSFADEVTVLRRGRLAGSGPVAGLDSAGLARMMVGAAPPKDARTEPARPPGQPRLRVDALSADDDLGAPALRGVSFDVREGEIVGVAAVAGNGQEELVEVLAGQRPRTGGTIYAHGLEYLATRDEIHEHRFRCLPEDPLRNACVATMSVAENLSLHTFDRAPLAWAGVGLRPGALRRAAAEAVAAFGIRAPSPDAPVSQLSGGNVQRVVLARELGGGVDVLVAANPCMGLDFGAVAEIHGRIRQARDRGAAVLLVSADLDEIFVLADRILVMSEGRIVHETPAAAADVGRVGQYMAGHHAHEAAAS